MHRLFCVKSVSSFLLPTSQELGVLKGQLSRWLLPYNAETSVDEQQAATPRRFQESLQASSVSSAAGGGVLTEQEAEYLTDGARKVRQLVSAATYSSSFSASTRRFARQCVFSPSCCTYREVRASSSVGSET